MAFNTHHEPPLATVTPATEQQSNEQVLDWLNRDDVEARAFYTPYFARRMGVRPLEDMSDRERFAFYLQRPPIGADGLPLPDEDGIFPRWYQLSATDQAYYQDCVRDYVKLMEAALAEVVDATE